VKIATWNVNSLKVRMPHVIEWLKANNPDVLVLQEIKQVSESFLAHEFHDVGYHSVANGQKTYNGVAVLAREEPRDPAIDFPHFADTQRRVLATTVGDVRVVNLYVPNGSEVGSEKYASCSATSTSRRATRTYTTRSLGATRSCAARPSALR
jgi:exodeoxyribonuclease-3